MTALHVGVDIGGTKVLAGEVAHDGEVLRTALRRMPGRHATPRELDDAVTTAVEAVAGDRTVEAVGLSVAGLVDTTRTTVHFSTHLPWQEDRTAERLSQRWGVRVVMDNDAACAALAELRHGAGRDHDDFMLITVGTGIGGAVVQRGEVSRGAHGMAGEFGHMRVVPEGRACECGLRGCFEQYASGNALLRLAGSAYGDGLAVTAAASDGDPVALQAMTTVGGWLGVGVAGLVGALDPGLVVVGGGVAEAGELLLEPARQAMTRSLVGAAHRELPEVVLAQCGSAAGMIGGSLLTRPL